MGVCLMRKSLRASLLLLVLAMTAALLMASGPGFRSQRQLDEHYAKHGQEFGNITRGQYLELAQALRDAPKGGNILQAVRADGVMTRFDRSHGYFGAYNPDGTIRTFFIPNAGESYFRRQIAKEHE
jgi:pyocin large subunit-like protein